MLLSQHLSKHIKDVHFGGNWTTSSLQEHLHDVNLEMALSKKEGMNTIAALCYHINYYIVAVTEVLKGGTLNASDAYSYNHPSFSTDEEWQVFKEKMWTDVNVFADLILQITDEQMWQPFVNEKYGNYYRNIQGIVEHTHYHLGQIVVIKKYF